MSCKKLMALTRMSSELNEDSVISMADFIAGEIALSFATTEDGCGFNGDGTSTYGGMTGIVTKFNADYATLAGAVTAATDHDTFAELTLADLLSAAGELPVYALRNAKWYCCNYAWTTVFQGIMAASGGNTTQTLTGQVGPAFLGYPVVVSQALPNTSGDLSNSVMLLFGDLALASTMGDRRGIALAVSTDRYFEFDQIGIKGTERFDINVHDIGDTTTAGPIVALIGN